MLLGLDRFQKTTLTVPEEGEEMDPTHVPKGNFDSSGHFTISTLSRFIVFSSTLQHRLQRCG